MPVRMADPLSMLSIVIAEESVLLGSIILAKPVEMVAMLAMISEGSAFKVHLKAMCFLFLHFRLFLEYPSTHSMQYVVDSSQILHGLSHFMQIPDKCCPRKV